MTHAEQHRMIQELKEVVHKMSGRDEMDFDMLRKRDDDDEDLDSLSFKRLQDLYERYVLDRKG
ncbi:MAG: hypothetical protein ACP5JH_09530 [Bacteroidota bacterium]